MLKPNHDPDEPSYAVERSFSYDNIISDYNIQMGETGVRECDGQFSGN